MLSGFVRRREEDAGSFSPRNEGTLARGPSPAWAGEGAGSETPASLRISSIESGDDAALVTAPLAAGAAGGGAIFAAPAAVAAAGGCAAVACTGVGVCNSDVPHMPQKRFVAGFSLPQRGQRTLPPPISIFYYL